ncbi:hypothetical protein KCU98_g4919, partial [Aureobasidium melanogenum]
MSQPKDHLAHAYCCFDPAGEEIPDEIWASLTAYVAQPSHATGQSNRVARLINGVARIAGNVSEATQEEEGALNRKLPGKQSPNHRPSAKLPPTKHPRQRRERRFRASKKPHLNTRPKRMPRSRNTMDLGPTKDGTEWQKIWAAIVEKQPINRVTNKPFVWLDNLTKVLVFMWGSSQGVNCVLKMVEAVYHDFDNLTLDAITSVSNPKSSVYTLEMRYKRVLSLSKAPALQTTELLLEYKNMADDFVRLEQQTQDSSTELGKEWAKREIDPKKETTNQARSNVVMQQVFRSMYPEEMTEDEKNTEMAKLRKMREYARNIANMIAIFGWGVVPLLACAPWKQVFADVSNTSAQACLQELAHAVPELRQICDRLDENFYRFLRIPGHIIQLPKDCLQGMSVKKQDRLSYTIAYHFAAPGEREEPGGMLNTKHLSHVG